jgi:hypothetical protein
MELEDQLKELLEKKRADLKSDIDGQYRPVTANQQNRLDMIDGLLSVLNNGW